MVTMSPIMTMTSAGLVTNTWGHAICTANATTSTTSDAANTIPWACPSVARWRTSKTANVTIVNMTMA